MNANVILFSNKTNPIPLRSLKAAGIILQVQSVLYKKIKSNPDNPNMMAVILMNGLQVSLHEKTIRTIQETADHNRQAMTELLGETLLATIENFKL